MRQGSRTLCEVPTGRLTALDGVQRGPRETSPVQGAPTHAGRKGPLCNSPLSLCRWPGVPSPSRLRPAFDERRHPERGVHHLPPRGAKPEAAGVLRHDHGRGRLDRKSPRRPRRTHTSRASGPAGPRPWMHASRLSASSGPHMSLRQAGSSLSSGPLLGPRLGRAERGMACRGCHGPARGRCPFREGSSRRWLLAKGMVAQVGDPACWGPRLQ